MRLFIGSLLKNSLGATVIELMATISTLAVLSAYAAPHYIGVIEKAEATVCLSERAVLERVGAFILAENENIKVLSIDEIVNQNYVNKMPECPSGGKYFWLKEKPTPTIGCTVHRPSEKEK